MFDVLSVLNTHLCPVLCVRCVSTILSDMFGQERSPHLAIDGLIRYDNSWYGPTLPPPLKVRNLGESHCEQTPASFHRTMIQIYDKNGPGRQRIVPQVLQKHIVSAFAMHSSVSLSKVVVKACVCVCVCASLLCCGRNCRLLLVHNVSRTFY